MILNFLIRQDQLLLLLLAVFRGTLVYSPLGPLSHEAFILQCSLSAVLVLILGLIRQVGDSSTAFVASWCLDLLQYPALAFIPQISYTVIMCL